MTKLVETTTNNIDIFDYLEQQQQKEARGQRVAEQLKTTTDPYALGRIMGQSSGRIEGKFSTADDEPLQGGIDFFDYLEQQQQQNVESDKFSPDNSWSEVTEPVPQTPFTPTAPAVEVTDIPANANRTEGNSIPMPNPEPYKSPAEQYFAERDKPVTAEERLLRGVDENTEKVLHNVEDTFKKAEIDRDTQTPEWSRASFTSDYGEAYEAAKFQTRQRKQAGADVVIKGVLEGVSQEQLRLTVEENIQARPDFKDLQKRMADDVTRISPMSGDLDLSDDQVSAVLDSLPDAERDDANKKIAEVTSNIEALQKYYTSEMERIYTSEYKAVEGKVYNRVIDKLAALKMPKSDLEYIGKAIWNNSLVGMAHELGFTIGAGASGADYVVTQQALAKANPSTAAEIAAGAGTILFDTAVFSALGGVGSLLSAVPRKLAERQVATQIARRAAVSATNKAVKETAKRVVENQAILKFAAATTEQAVSLGGYNAMLTAAQEYLSPTSENGTINWRQIFHRAAEGAITGGVLGSLSTGVQAGKAAMYRANPSMSVTARGLAADVGIDAGAFLAENAAFMGVGSLFSGEPITAEDFGHSVATLGVLKGVGLLKALSKGQTPLQRPGYVQRIVSDLKFTPEEMKAMREVGVDMGQIDIISEAISSANEAPSMGKLQLQTAYNRVMISRDIPTSAKIKLHYIVNGAMPSIAGPSGYSVVEGENGVEVHTTDYLGRLTDIKSFGDVESANKYVSRIAPLLEKNIIVDGAIVISGADALLAMNRAIDEYMTTSAYLESGQFASKSELMSEMLIANGAQKGTIPENSRARVETIQALAQNHKKTIDTVSALQGFVAKQHGATISELLHAINVKPDLRTSREALLVKDYVDALTAFNGSISGRAESQQAQREAQMRPQIEQAKQEVAEAQREADAIRESLNDAARKLSTADGQQIAVVRLESGEQVAVYRGRIALNSDGTIDRQASENMVVIKRIDAAGNEAREMISIDDIVEVVEQASSQEVVNATMDYIEKVAAKKRALDKAVIDSDGKGVEVEAIDGSKGKIMGYDENGAYIYRVKDSSGRDMDIPVSIEDISKLIEPQSDIEPTAETSEPQTIEGAAVSDAVEQVVEAVPAADDNTIVEYDEDFPPITEQDLAPQLDADKIEWDTLSPEDYSNASAIIFGDAETLSASHNYYTNSRDDLVKAKARVAEQQKVVERLKGRFATLSSPSQAQKLRKQVASAEQEKMKREQEVKNIEEQMSKYAYAMRKYGFDATTEERLLAEKADLEAERNALVEADAELDRYEQSEAAKVGKAISNTEANRNYIEQLYADRLGVSPSQAGPRQAVLWDLANGAIKLRWENTAPNAGAVQKGLAAELGLTGSAGERKAYKAVIAKDGQSVDGYVHDLWQRADWGADVDDMALKDIVLATLQSVPNGSLALKELLDMSGVQADLEAQISLGKGDIQRKLEEVDASLAKNSQQMADFRKRINNAVQKLENGEPIDSVNSIEKNAASSERSIADSHNSSSESLLQEGNAQLSGEPLTPLKDATKISKKTEIAKRAVQKIINEGGIRRKIDTPEQAISAVGNGLHMDKSKSSQSFYDDYYEGNYTVGDSVLHLRISTHPATDTRMGNGPADHKVSIVIRKNGEHRDTGEHNGYEEIVYEPSEVTPTEAANAIIKGVQSLLETGKYVDITGKAHTTIYPPTSIPENQISEEGIFGNAPISEDIPFMIEQKTADKGVVSEAEQNFEREVFDAFAGHLGETLGAESVVTDAAEAQRVLEWHQAVGERLRTAVSENAEIAAERAEIERVAKENGTWLKAPNGKDTNLTERQWVDVRTSRFKNWFGDWENDPENASKVVDENGEPLVMYHGSNWKLNNAPKNEGVFKMREGALGKGAYFTSVFAEAADYARVKIGRTELTEDEIEEGKYVTEAFLNIRDIENIWPSKYGQGGLNAVATEPNQIKSATENTGEYSPANDDIRMSIEAYHGSGADFEKFDHSFMGTGEGAQAYGWGSYVSSVEGVARTYADTMREKAISDKHRENAIINRMTKELLESRGGDKEQAIKELRDLLNQSWSDKKRVKAQIKIIETGRYLPETKKKAHLYTVEVPDNTGDNYISWDKEVPATMIERINNYIKENYGWKAHSEADLKQGMTGEQVYKNLTRAWGTQGGASMLLSDIGFTSVEYPAQYTTGGRADGAKNYVIFDADDVKIVDHVQYFKTPNGEVYGFVYEDKIYLDPTNIDPKAPVHEYTELWCREVAKANEELWKRGKELVKQTKVWEEVNADENYKNQSEDLRASEAWSRIIADEMMGKAREYGSKGLMAKLRGWLRSFWKTVKSVVEKWTKKELEDLTVDQFKKMTMADFINKVDPRKWNAKKPKEVSKSLVGIHNISLDKLQKALKQGGLANPSAAVIDIAKGDHFDYGEYSFIMPKSLVDKKSGRNIGTFDRDAWTPLYPSVEYSHSKESRKNLNKLVEGLDEGLADKIKRETLAKVNGNGFYSGLQIVFLKERGVEVPIASKAGKFFGTIDEFKQLFGDKEPTYENYQALDKAQKDEVTLWIRAKGMPEEIARYKELLVKPARKEGLWNFLLDDVGYGKFDQAVYGLQADARNVGTPDYEKTIDNAVNYIRENGLQEEFDAWQSETINNLGFDERIQVGWSPSGNRIMRKNTLENVSKYMRRQGKNASADHWSNSEGKMLAQLVQNFSSLDKIRANKGRLRSAADDVVGIRKRINEMAQVFMNFAKHTDLFMEEQSALAYLEDILVGGMNPDKVVAEFNAATKRNVTLTEEQKAEMKQLREDMKSLPVQYFETKFERPVMFNEFAAVVAPDTMPESVEQQLRDAGLAIYKYNPDVEGDRRKATLAATASEDIRFMIVGEKGAAALDQAEEATTRLDNLAVAREMEADFAERASRLEKLRNAEPIEITGNEVTPSEDLKQYRKNAKEYAKTLRGAYINKDTQKQVVVNRDSITEVLHHDGNSIPHIQSVAAIPQMIEESTYIATEPISNPSEKLKNAKYAHYYLCGLNIAGEPYTAKIVIAEFPSGEKYYDHSLTQIEKGELLNRAELSSTVADSKSPISDIKDKRLLDILQINDKENAKAIKLATGWERGADGKWRYEIDDRPVREEAVDRLINQLEYQQNSSIMLYDLLSDADELFAAYPDLMKLRVVVEGKSDSVIPAGRLEWADDIYDAQIVLNRAAVQSHFAQDELEGYGRADRALIRIRQGINPKTQEKFSSEAEQTEYLDLYTGIAEEYLAKYKKSKAMKLATTARVVSHEVQHAIQFIEGFARGSSVEEFDDKRGTLISDIDFATDGDFLKGSSISNAQSVYEALNKKVPYTEMTVKEAYADKLQRVASKYGYENIEALADDFTKFPSAFEQYHRTAGEVEARNVQKRILEGLTPEERRATLLSETEDVAREDQIFLESNLGVAQSVEVSEPVEAPTRKPRKSAAEKSLEKIESLREQLKNKKRSLNDTLLDVYNFLTSKDIAETMGEGVGKAQYRRVIKNSIEAIRKAYDVTDAEEKRKTIFKYLGEIDDNLSQLLTRQRLNEVTDILDKAIYGYTAQGVRTGKRIDEHTREIFDMLRNAIAEPVEEERDDSGRRKPVRYRLKNRTEAGDITASFRLRTQSSNDAGVIAKLRSDADEIINSVDELDTATTSKAAQLEYTANLLERYDNTLQLNEAIGQSTDEIAQILDNIDRVREKYKAAAVGSEERKNFYGLLKQLKTDLESEKMNRANLRHHYAAMLKTFTTSLEQLDEKGASEFVRAEEEKAEAAIKWRKGIYDSMKNPNAPVLPVGSKDRKGEEITVNWKGLNTRAKINESVFMATFAEMSRDIDINSIPGQWLPDGWYYQFMLAPSGYMERTDWRYKTEKALREELDAEILKLSGDKKADDPYKLFAALAQEPSGMTIRRMAVSTNKEGKVVGGYQENIPLTIGQLLYMRNTLRQPNGFAGYNAWGFSETYMQNIVEYVEAKYPQYCRFFDWVVSEFMPKLYDMQDAIYFKKFGTHLPKTAFYFPFVRDKRMVGKVAEVGEGEVSLPSSVTGNIVERVKTSAKMDLEADAFSVLQDHIKETLDWCAYSELTDKFNSVGTSHAFGNLLKAQGVSVERLKKVYEIAVGQGKINATDNTTLTKTLNAISKGLVAGNIVLNPNAAIKQIVSATATLGYSANPKLLAIWAKNFFVPSVIKTGIGKVVEKMKNGDIDPVEAIDWKVVGDNWKWAIENIPTLRERWEGREAGFEVLKSHSFDSWDKLTAMITNVGLAPNAFVDMLTCSNAAKTVYEYEYPRLLERGRSKVEAHREACVKAAIFVNETQQSSLNGFLSSFQSGGGLQRILGVGLGAYQNSSMAFARNERFALTNMLRMLNPATRNDMQMRQIKAYKELGVEEHKVAELAKIDLRESYGQQVAGFVHNGVLNNYIWKIAGVLLGGLASAGFAAMFDKEEWNKLWKNEKFRQELASVVSAETLAWQTPLFYNAPITKQILEYSHNVAEGKAYGGIFESPTSQSAQDLIDAIFKQWVGVKNEITGERETKEPTRYDRSAEWLVASTLIKAGLGVNPDLVVRIAQGIDDMMKDGVQVEDVMATLASPRGLTRAIAGEPRPGESKEEYLDRMSYIYRQVNAGSGKYDKRFVAERTKEYIQQKDAEIYRELGIVPRDARVLEARVKSIKKMLLYFDRSEEGRAEFNSLPQSKRDMQKEIAKEYNRVYQYTRALNNGVQSYDAANIAKRKQYLRERYEAMRRVSELWVEYNKK